MDPKDDVVDGRLEVEVAERPAPGVLGSPGDSSTLPWFQVGVSRSSGFLGVRSPSLSGVMID
jgi:hypothetical protein